MDLANVCRVCLAEKLELFNIFETAENSFQSFSEIVQQIALVTIDESDLLSKNICSTCRDSCIEYLKFREMILSSNDYQQIMVSQKKQLKNEGEEPIEAIVIEQIESDEMNMIEEEEKPLVDEPYTLSIDISDVPEAEADTEDQYIFSDELNDDMTCADLITSASSDDSDSETMYVCSFCNRHFRKFTKLQDHIKTHTKARLFPCKTCKRKFTTDVLLTRHEIIHSDLITQIKSESVPRCIICNGTFTNKSDLEEHMREYKQRLQTEIINCQYCEKPFSKLSALIRHMKSHDQNKTHLCNVCNRTFAMGQELIDHLNRHKGFTPHKCHLCNKSYMQITKLKNHLKTHSDDKVRTLN